MEMKKLKVVRRRFEGYTGVLGRVRFTNGVSDEYLPRHIRDQMAASMEFIEIDMEGNEEPAGAQHRMIREYKVRHELQQALGRQTEEEKLAEVTKNTLDASVAPELHTREQLTDIADKGGMKALREVAAKWNVKHRKIPVLIDMILDKERAYTEKRNAKLAEKVAAELGTHPVPAVEVEAEAEVVPEVVEVVEEDLTPVVSANTSGAAAKINEALKAAAASGNLAAALGTESE